VPEVMFNPSDISINQAGIPEMITQTVNKCPSIFRRDLYSNIILTGGNSQIPGFKARIANDLASLKPAECTLSIQQLDRPELAAWRGMRLFAATDLA